MAASNGRLFLISNLICGLVVLAAASFVCYLVGSEILLSTVTFDTDEADHATPALELYTAIKRGGAAGIYDAIVRQAFYPPLHSFFVTTSYLIVDPSLVSSRMPSLVIFVLYLSLLSFSVYFFLKQRDSTKSHLASACAILAGLVAALSPITIYNSALCMLELPGMLFITLCIFLFVRWEHWVTNPKAVVLITLVALAVFFTKYSFGIMSVPACIATFFLCRYDETRFSIRLKNALLSFCVAALSVLVWTYITDRGSFYHFFVGHRSYAPRFSRENLLYELTSWLSIYTAGEVLAVVVLILAAIGSFSFRRAPAAVFSFLNTAFAFFILAMSTTNEERHFMVALPTIIFLAALGAYSLLRRVNYYLAVLVTAASVTSIMFFAVPRIPEVKFRVASQFEGEPHFLELFSFINGLIDPSTPVLLYGISDDFSIEALRWYVAKEAGFAYREVRLDAYPYRDDKNFTARKRKRNLDRPYVERGFPKKPLTSVLAQNYYRFAVHINNTSRKQRFLKEGNEFREMLADQAIGQMTRGSREITVYKLK